MGAIRPNKGLDIAIEAFAQVAAANRNVFLVVAGEPCQDFGRYRDRIRKLGLADRVVEKLDYIPNDEVHLFFTAADLVLLPYREITQSGVLHIAYAFGKPVIVTALKGFFEAVEDGRNGFIVPGDDPVAMGQRMIDLFNSRDLMSGMGRNSRLMADEKFSWGAIAKRTNQVYSSFETAPEDYKDH